MDSVVFGDSIGTQRMRDVFSESAMLQRWLEVEVALAQAQASLGIIPPAAAERISADKADIRKIDLHAVQSKGKKSGHSLLGLLEEFRRVIDHEDSRYVHFGATTQDIIDTGLMLMIKEAYDIVLAHIKEIMRELGKITETHADTLMVGRTHGNHGLPITFGFKVAIWLSELSRQLERWQMARDRILVGNLTGGVGTFASWGDKGPEVQSRALSILGLGVPETVWHSSRDRVAEALSLSALLAGTCVRIAREIYNLSRTEFREVMEPSAGKIGSSTMPHKRNPIHSEWIMVLERVIRGNASIAFEVMGQENERDASRWKNEWIAVPETFVMLSGILNHIGIVTTGLTVNEERMQQNTGMLKGMLLSEKAMFLLERHFPLPQAHQIVHEASIRAMEKDTPLVDELMRRPEIAKQISREDLEKALDPAGYVGQAPMVARQVKDRVKELLH